MVEEITISNLSKKTSILISMNQNDFVLQSVDWGVIASSHNTTKYLNQVGEYLIGTTLGTRVVSISGWVVGLTQKISQKERPF